MNIENQLKEHIERNEKDHDILIEVHTTVLAILKQTEKTNGRVTALESWRNYIAGGLALFCLIGLPIIWVYVDDAKKIHTEILEHITNEK